MQSAEDQVPDWVVVADDRDEDEHVVLVVMGLVVVLLVACVKPESTEAMVPVVDTRDDG